MKYCAAAFTTLLAVLLSFFESHLSAEPPDTQEETIPFLSPKEALAAVDAPEGFRVSLFAAEPQVRQPIAMAFDTRGRLWVAECETYTKSNVFDTEQRDRVVVFEDANDDGQADRRTVFWDQGQRLTSVEIGFGGVWALCPPQLLFIPDADRDDRPDGEPIVALDGWSPAGHTFVNGLRWGPDGWLYGRHGIQGVSHVGAPGTPDELRTPVSCGIWRYHPRRKTFEVVCHGTTNPWGMDWDDRGELFFINTVIGHLWQAIPGAHYRRMYGDDLRPRLYELIEQTADHVHWDEGQEDWTATRKELSPATSRSGGGHAHTGLMIYLGENWPEKYRGELFTLNLHGRRINHDRLERAGATYVGRHCPDLMSFGDPWFRGIDLAYGRDGGVYVLDWSDIGECHEADGIHRTSGRIYKIWRPTMQPPLSGSAAAPADMRELSTEELAGMQLHRNEWLVRQSRRVLEEREAAGGDLSAAHQTLWRMFGEEIDTGRRLRALWCLYVTGGIGPSRLLGLLEDDDEHLRAWGIRLLIDRGKVDAPVIAAFQELANRETSGLVLTYLASALERLPDESRFPLAECLSRHAEFADDRVLPLLIWYGVEPAVLSHLDESLRLIVVSRMPRVTRYVARRLTEQIDERPEVAGRLVELVRDADGTPLRAEILRGMAEALRGRSRAPAPRHWAELAKERARTEDKQMSGLVRELSIVFGKGISPPQVIDFVLDAEQPAESRKAALAALVAARAEGLEPALKRLIDDRHLTDEAVRGLAALDLSRYASYLVDRYGRLDGPGKKAIVAVLASRADTASLLLDAVDRRLAPAGDVDAFLLRQMQLLGDDALTARIAKMWPDRRLLSGDKLERIKQYRGQLNQRILAAADPGNGRKVYRQTCGQCHRLFGEGGAIGPELTGAQRQSLDYWLENMVDPSAAVPEQYRMSVVALDDGRVLSGLVRNENERMIALQTPTERRLIERSTIEAIEPSPLSIMPEGQLEKLSDVDLRDLFGYLMSPSPPRAVPSQGR